MILVAPKVLHEVGHLIAGRAVGAMATVVSIIPVAGWGGWCAFRPAPHLSPLQRMVIDAAGDAAELLDTWHVSNEDRQRIRQSLDASLAALPVDNEIRALCSGASIAEGVNEAIHGGRDLVCDWESIGTRLEELVRAGRIKRRRAMQQRWWRRCRRIASRLIAERMPEFRALAGALAVQGVLTATNIHEIVGIPISGQGTVPCGPVAEPSVAGPAVAIPKAQQRGTIRTTTRPKHKSSGGAGLLPGTRAAVFHTHMAPALADGDQAGRSAGAHGVDPFP